MGGIENHIHGLASYLASRGHHVYVFTSQIKSNLNKTKYSSAYGKFEEKQQRCIKKKDNYLVVRFEPYIYIPTKRLATWQFLLQYNLSVRNFLAKNHIDILHLHDLVEMNGLYLLSRIGNRPKTVVTLHGSIYPRFPPLFAKRIVIKLLLEKPDKIITISKTIQKQVISYGIPREKVHYIPNWVNTETFQPSRTRTSAKEPLVIYVGRMTRMQDKGVGLILGAIKNLQEKHVAVQGLFVGTGPDLEYFRQLSRRIHITDRVNFLGHVPKTTLVNCYQKATIFALPSEYEGLSIAILEALSCGIPVISSDVGSTPEVVTEGVGFVLKEKSVDALEQAILELIIDARRRETMGRNARKRILLEYDAKVVLPRIERVYEELLDV